MIDLFIYFIYIFIKVIWNIYLKYICGGSVVLVDYIIIEVIAHILKNLFCIIFVIQLRCK